MSYKQEATLALHSLTGQQVDAQNETARQAFLASLESTLEAGANPNEPHPGFDKRVEAGHTPLDYFVSRQAIHEHAAEHEVGSEAPGEGEALHTSRADLCRQAVTLLKARGATTSDTAIGHYNNLQAAAITKADHPDYAEHRDLLLKRATLNETISAALLEHRSPQVSNSEENMGHSDRDHADHGSHSPAVRTTLDSREATMIRRAVAG